MLTCQICNKSFEASVGPGDQFQHNTIACALRELEAARSSHRVVIDAVIDRAEQACRYALKHNEDRWDSDTSEDFRNGWEVAAHTCEAAIRPHVTRHIAEDLRKPPTET